MMAPAAHVRWHPISTFREPGTRSEGLWDRGMFLRLPIYQYRHSNAHLPALIVKPEPEETVDVVEDVEPVFLPASSLTIHCHFGIWLGSFHSLTSLIF